MWYTITVPKLVILSQYFESFLFLVDRVCFYTPKNWSKISPLIACLNIMNWIPRIHWFVYALRWSFISCPKEIHSTRMLDNSKLSAIVTMLVTREAVQIHKKGGYFSNIFLSREKKQWRLILSNCLYINWLNKKGRLLVSFV